MSALKSQAASGPAQMERIRTWALGNDAAVGTLQIQAETSKKSLGAVAKELNSVKKQQKRFQAVFPKIRESERKKTDSQAVGIQGDLDRLQGEIEREVEDSLSKERMKELHKLFDDARTTIEASGSHTDDSVDAIHESASPPA